MELLKWVDQSLKDIGVFQYKLYPSLIAIPASSTVEIAQKNDVYFLVDAFTSNGGPINGEIISSQNALALKPHIIQTKCYKHQPFRGGINIVNADATQVMYVEMMIASPVFSN